MSINKFRTLYNRSNRVAEYDKLSSEEHELHDSLTPLSVGEQVSRFISSGEVFEATRRRELASLRGVEIDDPDDFASPLDVEHVDPADLKNAQEAMMKAQYEAKKNEDIKKSPETSGSNSGIHPVDNSTAPEREGTTSPKAKAE